MRKAVNYLNAKWNRLIHWFHAASTRTGIKWLTMLSVWVYDRLIWHLSDEWQLICGMPVKEYMLRHDLEVARHQTRYFADYAYELQCRILFSDDETGDGEAQNQAAVVAEQETSAQNKTLVRATKCQKS